MGWFSEKGSDESKSGVWPDIRTMKAQDDAILWNTSGHKHVRNPVFRSVPLNPHLTIHNIEMNQAAMHPLHLLPTHRYNEVTVVVTVKHRFVLDVSIGIPDVNHFGEDFPYDLPIIF